MDDGWVAEDGWMGWLDVCLCVCECVYGVGWKRRDVKPS